MTVDEFLRWSERQEQGRYELEGGRVIAMPAETIGHVRIKALVHSALTAAISSAHVAYVALTDGISVRISPNRAYEPDALVAPLPLPPDDSVEIPSPVIVVEVLSPSAASARRVLTNKVAGYALVPSIQHYLIIDPAERVVYHYKRVGELLAAPQAPAEGVLRLDPPGIEVSVVELLGPEPAA